MSNTPPVPPQPDDTIAWITVRHHANGQLSVSGTIGDPVHAKKLLDHAKDAITRQVPAGGIIIPGRDVQLPDPALPGLQEMGYLPPDQRGDG